MPGGSRVTAEMLDRQRVALARQLEAMPFAPAALVPLPLARPLRLPTVPVVTVGGTTFGGSGKTRLALAVARELGAVLVGHAHRARPLHARRVKQTDLLEVVGDEALVCARSYEGPVIVAPTRQAAVDLAATYGRPIVIDGPLQTRPRRAALSLLAVDPERPWSGGDQRASRARLLAATDLVVDVETTLEGIEVLQNTPFGLFTALARPGRLVRALAAKGLFPRVVASAPDHGGLVQLPEAPIECWLATPKCAIHLEALGPRMPIVELVDRFVLPESIRQRVVSLLTWAP